MRGYRWESGSSGGRRCIWARDYTVHIVNFGGEESVNAAYRADPERAEAEIAGIAGGLTLPHGVNPADYARRVWISERIRRGGGLCILPHPFWIVNDAYNMNLRLLDFCMRSGLYDAMEIMTGQTVHENNLQVTFYMEQRAKGVDLPFGGVERLPRNRPGVLFRHGQNGGAGEVDRKGGAV